MHFNEKKKQRLNRHTRPKMGNSTNERKIEKKARQAMVEQNLRNDKTLPKTLRTQALTALTSNFGLEGLVQYAW